MRTAGSPGYSIDGSVRTYRVVGDHVLTQNDIENHVNTRI